MLLDRPVEEARKMGTREVYEQKLRNGNLVYDPTMNPGLGTSRCPRCLSIIDPNSEYRDWSLNPVLRDATLVVGAGLGGLLSAIYNINTGIPYIQNRVMKGPRWLPFVVGIPSLLLFSASSAAFGAYALPKFTQLTVFSYYAASSASQYGISQLTRRIEEAHITHKKD